MAVESNGGDAVAPGAIDAGATIVEVGSGRVAGAEPVNDGVADLMKNPFDWWRREVAKMAAAGKFSGTRRFGCSGGGDEGMTEGGLGMSCPCEGETGDEDRPRSSGGAPYSC